MSATKEKILEVSLNLFSERGFSAVSIRDICKQVDIKESSIYYHFKNKQTILEELLSRFQNTAAGMMNRLEHSLTTNQEPLSENFYQVVCDHFFEDYLMDDFCNRVIRLMMIEQFHNEQIKETYDHWMFDVPLEFQSGIFAMLAGFGVIRNTDSDHLAVSYYAPIFLYAQKWLFCGTLSEEKKQAFRRDAYHHIHKFFSELGGA